MIGKIEDAKNETIAKINREVTDLAEINHAVIQKVDHQILEV